MRPRIWGSGRFAVPEGYLDTPSIGIPPAAVADAVAGAVARWRAGSDRAPDFDEHVARSRAGFGRLAGVPAERVAIGASVSQLIANVAGGLGEGARVLVAEKDFTSVTFPFAARPGTRLTEAPMAKLADHVEGHDLVAVSLVQSSDGSVLDLAALRAAAESAGAGVLLDVTQAAGWLPLDLAWADWVVCAGYKWLFSPRGCAWLAVHPRAHERTRAVAANWYAGDDPRASVYGLPLRSARDARAFDLSPVWLAHVGAAAALDYVTGLDLAAVREHTTGLADSLLRALGRPARGSAIVALEADPARVAAAGVVASVRAGRVRAGFHLYNTADDVERLLTAFG
ncbi:aminotransferase class V-fold PLP-dependent enzyme [Amycolatopsis sp. PS_44_ISF1]|uniref:aminotransferase class V-fold PLP-dependent enzyme n=1 Tax=Amycolatopsis sp. PS_44_ISF1 TaxID=2974917 RepID=UPI0028DED4B5|nr:aminotransferase class V-fold PLP-dependent enzyme [Amycolatopsis sp. PS_44_ISF1]MDT8914790.1 aminotransferase class V-fold PLP-dependent enzyme [Amycolatopsis sp. PS_44_ISF1]